MNKLVVFFISFIITLSLVAFISLQNETVQVKSETVKVQETNANDLFFIVTGFSSAKSNINRKSINNLAREGKFYCLEAYKSECKQFFGDLKVQYLKDVQSFNKIAEDKFLFISIQDVYGRFKILSVDSVSFFENPEKYPLQVNNSAKTYLSQMTTYMHTGVTAISRGAGMAADIHGVGYLTDKVKPYFKGADYVHISNEVSMTSDCEYVRGTTKFCTKEKHFQAIKDIGCNVVELTGNHNKDFGSVAYSNTLEWYKTQGIKVFGGGTDKNNASVILYLDLKDGKKMALLGFNEACPLNECCTDKTSGALQYTYERASSMISEAKKNADFVMVGVQFTEWDKYEPHASQLKISRTLIDLGADMVYGSQAHQIMQVEMYKNKPIFHGMGNFLFDQIHRTAVRQAFFFRHYFYKGKWIQGVPNYTWMSDGRQQQIASPEQETEIRKAIFVSSLIYN